ncbi:DUF305 domain-containing protein [Kineosporia sp. NBRC 101731]|uniref:DUF305 domain-containing protein n=1 Tax=Kineosporia sp. NBRC 101731 TaxID=3032199 RepID=UPI0024A603E4|nr:DUF305 domain-containing protein [Kineosporia sp. NBRC 101731]GLY33227.1 hypothetical protein Kisp02_65920 [Kineosporia sp. NBRC 101731]
MATLVAGAALLLGGCSVPGGLTISTGSTDEGTASISSGGHSSHATASATEGEPGDGGETGHNAADVMFLQMMIAREVETAKLAALADGGTLSKEVTALIGAISSTENDERAEMTGWLKAWGEPAEADADMHAEHGGVSTLTKADIKALKSASGSRFQTTFLNLLLAQQSNGAEIAQYATDHGKNGGVLELAGRIHESRSAQVQHMLNLL